MSSPTYTAFIKLGRLVTRDVLYEVDSLPVGAEFYQRGALKLMPGAPVLVDHDDDRPIGFARELCEFPDTDGEWLAALTTITAPPGWLKRGTAASIGYASLYRQPLGDAERVLRGLATEVSVLSPGRRPAQPRAQVALFRRSTDEAAPGGQVFYGGEMIRRPAIGTIIGIR